MAIRVSPLTVAAVSNSFRPEVISAAFDAGCQTKLDTLHVFEVIESTNTFLARQSVPTGQLHAAVAAQQTAGRGRGGKRWLSPPGASLCLSLACSFSRLPEQLPALTLSVGVGLARQIESLLDLPVQLKWPNDLILNNGKLGGILTELSSSGASSQIVVGVGINCELPADFSDTMEPRAEFPAVDLQSTDREVVDFDRSVLAGALLAACATAINTFVEEGLRPFVSDYISRDCLCGREVTVQNKGKDTQGIARGIDASGALLVDAGQGPLLAISSGSVELTKSLSSGAVR
ncbi:MAG: biotin--[acetyl-CoA-carboxylase] ligase [Pseudomonadota bacterium]